MVWKMWSPDTRGCETLHQVWIPTGFDRLRFMWSIEPDRGEVLQELWEQDQLTKLIGMTLRREGHVQSKILQSLLLSVISWIIQC